MKADLEDTGFMEGMQALLGFDEEKVEALLDELDSNSLLALADAIAKNDKRSAERIVGSYENEMSSLFKGKDVEQKQSKKKKHPVKPSKDHVFSIGDDVAIKTTNEDTGDDEFVSGTVYKPHAPGDTIGVKIDGKSKMVSRNEVYTLKEMVLGMVGIPDIQRMKKLAGIQSDEVSVAPAQVADEQEPMRPSEMEVEMGDMAQAISALDTLEDVLPNIRLADLKIIRQRLSAIQMKMNESVVKPGRTKKL